MARSINTLSCITLSSLIFGAGCSDPQSEEDTYVMRYQGAANEVQFWELADDLGYMEGIELEWVGDTTSGPENIQSTMTGDVEFGGAFNGAILQLQREGAEVTSVIHYYGSDEETYTGYYVNEESTIEKAEDLIGKNVGVNTLGAHHEFAVVEYARQSGLSEEQIDEIGLVVIPPASAEQTVRSDQMEVVQLGDIQRDVALERGGLRPLFKDIDLFGNFNAGSIVFRDDYIEQNPGAVEAFVDGMSRAIEWAEEKSTEEVKERMTMIIEERDRNEDTDLIEHWQSTSIESPGGVIRPEDFERWIDWLEEDGALEPGELQLDDVYTNEFNPYKDETEGE